MYLKVECAGMNSAGGVQLLLMALKAFAGSVTALMREAANTTALLEMRSKVRSSVDLEVCICGAKR